MLSSHSAKWNQLIDEVSGIQADLQLAISHWRSMTEPILTADSSAAPPNAKQSSQNDSLTIASQLETSLGAYLATKLSTGQTKDLLLELQPRLGHSSFQEISAFLKNTPAIVPKAAIVATQEYQTFISLIQDLNMDLPNLDEREEDILMTKQTESFTCPITLQIFQNPYKNPLCGHTYSLNAIKALAGKRTSLQCPVAGCTRDVKIAKLVPDDSMVRKMKHRLPTAS